MLRRKKSKADAVKDKASDLQERAVDTLGPKADEAREATESAIDAANTRVREDIAPKVREEVVPAVASALGQTKLADTKLAETALVDPPKKKKKSKLKKLVVLAGLGGVAFFVTKKIKDSQSGPPVPPPAPRPTPAPSPPGTPSRPDAAAAPDSSGQTNASDGSKPSGA